MKSLNTIICATAGIILIASCKKSDTASISTPAFQIGKAVSDTAPLSGSIYGTMLSGKTYTIASTVTIPKGDTLLLQPGVTVKVNAGASITVQGTFISRGTQDSVNVITPSTLVKQDNPNTSATSDPAFAGTWLGINCDTTCALFVMKYTHLEGGGETVTTPPVSGLSAGSPSYVLFFQNIKGIFDLEDSWIYGTTDDAVRITSGTVNIMRNTFEKTGQFDGEALNVKSGTVGNIGYNLFIGAATNGTKISNAGATAIECNINLYNNTYVDCGYRQSTPAGHGGSIDIEKGARGNLFNNLIVNCRVGLRLYGNPIASAPDTVNTKYGNTFFYGDSLSVANMFYPVGDITHPQSTDIPNPSYLPVGYSLGAVYTAPASIIGSASGNSGLFRNFPLPNYHYQEYTYATGYDFHLAASSPAIGKGTTTLNAMAVNIPINPYFGATQINAPGADIGCYQINGTGNQH